jgi:hypothetical protein
LDRDFREIRLIRVVEVLRVTSRGYRTIPPNIFPLSVKGLGTSTDKFIGFFLKNERIAQFLLRSKRTQRIPPRLRKIETRLRKITLNIVSIDRVGNLKNSIRLFA